MVNIKKFIFNSLKEHTYLVWDESAEAAVIDPAYIDETEKKEFYDFIAQQGLKPAVILITHGHVDHICGVKDCADSFGIPVYMSGEDEYTVRVINQTAEKMFGIHPDTSYKYIDMKDRQKITFGNTEVTVITTAGHSPGSVCFHIEKEGILFSGDTLFAGSIGRTDFPCSSLDAILKNITEKLLILDGNTQVLPGHGAGTTIGRERLYNPFLNTGDGYEQI